ncbi:MAG: DUF302 domain-containing protein [Chloroflexi bacterium]|nr:DUF302 domain-containing protein [Chloroflexota bacterium]
MATPSTSSPTGYGFGTMVRQPVADAVAAVTDALKSEGFGVLTTIDVQATLRAKLGLETAPYLILGACNPTLAHRALTLDPNIGLLLPCNVVVRAAGDDAEVLIMDPDLMVQVTDNPALAEVAGEAKARLMRVVARLSQEGGAA